MKVFERKLQGIAGSLLVSLPKTWTDQFSLKKGTAVKLAITQQGMLMVSPQTPHEQEKKEVVLTYDTNFVRRFFREYFTGNEKIIVKFEKKIEGEEKKEIYAFLKKFMNVQIIEESEKRIVLRSFRIEELSIEECLSRMFYLSLNMIDEWKNTNDTVKMNEIGLTIKRFYYMLVMQIRRFIGEGKFAEQNQISLVRAMDCRMVGTNIDRIAEIMLKTDPIQNKEVAKLLEEFTDFYKHAFAYFISDKYEKAIEISGEDIRLEKKYAPIIERLKKTRDVAGHWEANQILLMIKQAKQISMMIR